MAEQLHVNPIKLPKKKQAPKPLCFIPTDLVTRSVNPKYQIAFTRFLGSILGPNNTLRLIDEYRLGVTKSGDVIFFQIDVHGRCRTGKVMKYDPESGHRIKDENIGGRVIWVHSLMKRSGALKPEYVWLATGGKRQFGSKLDVLKGRTVVAFPDIDGYEEWKSKLSTLGITVSDWLELTATEYERKRKIDLADRIIEERLFGCQRYSD